MNHFYFWHRKWMKLCLNRDQKMIQVTKGDFWRFLNQVNLVNWPMYRKGVFMKTGPAGPYSGNYFQDTFSSRVFSYASHTDHWTWWVAIQTHASNTKFDGSRSRLYRSHTRNIELGESRSRLTQVTLSSKGHDPDSIVLTHGTLILMSRDPDSYK